MNNPLSRTILAAAFLALSPLAARADYIQASRQALAKAAPTRDADTIATLSRGDRAELVSTEQSDGYYHVRLQDGSHAFIYRTFVRRFTGPLPPDSTGSSTTKPAPLNADRGTYYASDPVATSPQSNFVLLDKTSFRIGYSESHANPLWTSYAIGPATDLVAYPRKRFATDTNTTARISHDDYTNQNYSRGHMAPRLAISTRFGKVGNDATFIMSNVCPQYQDFNDGPWGNLEEWIAGRKANQRFIMGWGDVYTKVWVTVGPIFEATPTRFAGKVDVPAAYYCIVIDEDKNTPRALAFIMNHTDTRESDLVGSLRTIDEIESRTGLDFFSALPDTIEATLERTKATTLWTLPEMPN